MNTVPEQDIFAKRWLVAAVVVLSLLMPLLMGCGVKGDLKRKASNPPAPAATTGMR